MTAELLLHNATQAALVDLEDLAELRRWRWFELGGYVVRQQRTATGTTLVYLHRQLLRASRVEVVDHINNNRLDNRRANLRLCSQSENLANRPAPMPHGYRGVYPEVRGGNWRAQIKVGGRNKRLGTYPTPEAAARAYDVAALAAWGRFARLNFPGETPAQLGLDLEGDPFDVPAPVTRLDWYELRQLRAWREAGAVAIGAFSGQIDNCGIEF